MDEKSFLVSPIAQIFKTIESLSYYICATAVKKGATNLYKFNKWLEIQAPFIFFNYIRIDY